MSTSDDSTALSDLPRAWYVLFTSLCLSAGHGIAMYLVIARHDVLPTVQYIGDKMAVTVMVWFQLAVPLALFALLARRRLARSSWLPFLALLAALLTLVAYVGHRNYIAQS